MNQPGESNKPLSELAERLGPSEWETGRQTSIGGAGVSTALVLLLTQIGPSGDLLQASFYTAAIAIPIWLGLWQVSHAYSLNPEAEGHFCRIGAFVGSGMLISAGILTFSSLFTLILAYSLGAGLAFGFMSFAMLIFVFSYHISVRKSGK